MSVKLTESWIQFARATLWTYGPNAAPGSGYNFAANTVLKWSTNAWGCLLYGPGRYVNSAAAIVQDPSFPDRSRLRISVGGATVASYGCPVGLFKADTSAVKRRLGFLVKILTSVTSTQITFGTGKSPNAGYESWATHPCRLAYGDYPVVAFYKAANSTVVQISHCANGVETPLSYALTADKEYYVEVEMDTAAGTYRVWVDDYLIIDASMAAEAKTALLSSWGWVFRGNDMASAHREAFLLSDIYYLVDDGVGPSARLGKTTRVKGELPSADVSVSFDRPTGFTSNYDVVNDPISSTAVPTAYLTGSGVGASDIYAVPPDTYAAQVYAVKVATIAANFSSAAHRVDAVIKDGGGNTQTQTLATLAAGEPFTPMQAVFTVAPDGSAFTPQNVSSANFGYTIAS